MAIPSVGSTAPSFSLPNQDGKMASLSGYAGKWLVVYFYPRDNTPGCSIEGQAFSTFKEEFTTLNCEIVGVSADSVKSHCSFISKKNLTIDLLSDENKVMCKAYGIWQPKKFMGKEFLGIIRSTFLIDPSGNVAFIWSPVKVKGHVKDVLEKVRELV
ncbi:TPA: thioredoxin-dependent thiol peroxidase [Candidatus Woesearchaeota archaeon]|nr:thioredoxin-dependent thiol peroxidase [archaeon]HIJ12009.1 thioredoxin-dependent thiol peroxidase [Candidatus Woesearchaeota archaeon]